MHMARRFADYAPLGAGRRQLVKDRSKIRNGSPVTRIVSPFNKLTVCQLRITNSLYFSMLVDSTGQRVVQRQGR